MFVCVLSLNVLPLEQQAKADQLTLHEEYHIASIFCKTYFSQKCSDMIY